MQNSKNHCLLLKKLRIENLLTQQEMADLLFVSKPTYANWEKDIGKIPLVKFTRMIGILKIDTNIIFDFLSPDLKTEIIKESKNDTDNELLSLILNKINDLQQQLSARIQTFAIIFLLFSTSVYAQNNYLVKGLVVDTAADVKLLNASVSILNSKDSILLKFTRTDPDGLFSFDNLNPGEFILLVTYPNYVGYTAQFTLNSNKKAIDFGILNLPLKSRLLNEVIVKGKSTAVKIKGDTTEFNAGSFVIEPNAKVEDLLRQLPGLQIDRYGGITAYGQVVKKVLVDGEEFFGDDPTLATKNIRGDMVDKIQLYDKKSDQAAFTGIDDGKGEKTIDIKLKEDKKNGYFGKVDAGFSNDEYHQAQAMFNTFKGKEKLAAYALTGNNGKVGLGWQDNSIYGSASLKFGSGGMMLTGGDGDPDSFDGKFNGQGIPTAHSGGLHYDTKWRDNKESVNLNYKIGSLGIGGVRDNLSQNNLPNGLINNNSNQIFNSSVFRQNMNAVYETKIDSTLTIKVSLNGTLKNSNNKNNFKTTSIRGNNNTLLNKSDRDLSNEGNEKIVNSSAFLSKKLHKKGRTISLLVENSYQHNDSEGFLNSKNEFYNNSASLDSIQSINQFKKNNAVNYILNSNATYTEPITKNISLILNSGITTNIGKANRKSFNPSSTTEYKLLDTLFSNNFESNQFIKHGGVIFNYHKDKNNINFGSTITHTVFSQKDLFTNKSYDRDFLNWNPQASYQYNFTGQKNLKLNYNGDTNQPNLDQLQPVRINNDPLNITIGNPNLKPSFRNKINLEYNSFKMLTNQGFNINGSYSFVSSPIVNNIMTDAAGKNTYLASNLSSKTPKSYSFYTGFQKMLRKSDLSLGLALSTQGNNYYNIINSEVNKTVVDNYSATISISKFKQSKYNFMIGLTPSYNIIETSLQNQINNNGWSVDSEVSFTINLPSGISVVSLANYEYREQTQLFNRDFNRLIWNTSINKKFFKDQSLTCAIVGNDLLNQNIGFRRNAFNNMVVQESFTTIRRYFMFSLTWDFNKMGHTQQKIQLL